MASTRYTHKYTRTPDDLVASVEDYIALSTSIDDSRASLRPPVQTPKHVAWVYIAITSISFLINVLVFLRHLAPSIAPQSAPDYFPLASAAVRHLQSAPADVWRELIINPSLLPDFSSTLLLVNFNMGSQLYSVIPELLELYQPFFPNIQFYGADAQPATNDTYGVEAVEQRVPDAHEWGAASYRSLLAAYEAHPHYEGYLFINDDVALNPFALANFSRSLLWSEGMQAKGFVYSSPDRACEEAQTEGWRYAEPAICRACSKAVERLPASAKRRIGRNLVVGQADAYYVPSRLMPDMASLLAVFSDEGCWLEVAVPTASNAFEKVDRVDLQATSRWLWGDSRNRPADVMVDTIALIHPVKIAAIGATQAKDMIKLWLIKAAVYWAEDRQGAA